MNYIVFDCETANTMDDPFVYDLGWSVIDDNFNVLVERSFVNADIFIEEKDLMKVAYFADKIPQYVAEIADGTRELRRFETIRRAFALDCKMFGVTEIYAHNARFDYKALQTTQRYLTKSKYRWFFPFGVEICDTLKMARQTFGKCDEYKEFCIENGFTLANGKTPRFTAEILYRFITKDLQFKEEHTGLADVRIEREIFRHCVQMDPSIERRLWAN